MRRLPSLVLFAVATAVAAPSHSAIKNGFYRRVPLSERDSLIYSHSLARESNSQGEYILTRKKIQYVPNDKSKPGWESTFENNAVAACGAFFSYVDAKSIPSIAVFVVHQDGTAKVYLTNKEDELEEFKLTQVFQVSGSCNVRRISHDDGTEILVSSGVKSERFFVPNIALL